MTTTVIMCHATLDCTPSTQPAPKENTCTEYKMWTFGLDRKSHFGNRVVFARPFSYVSRKHEVVLALLIEKISN